MYLLSIAFSTLDHSAFNRIIVQVLIASQDKLFQHLDQLFHGEFLERYKYFYSTVIFFGLDMTIRRIQL